ncbi:MAG: outer membrane protein transport protein [Gammaproteobacteria bacterium]|nr:outer membrane protein transport protein [Gammaproteobacteria bacterium]
MGRIPKIIQQFSRVISLFFILNNTVMAGGFSLYTEGSVSELGVFAAGSAAQVPDASIGWYNPAGLVLIPEDEIVFSGVGVLPNTTLTGTSTYRTDDLPPYIQSFDTLNGGRNAVVPALHLAHPLGERAVAGLSIVSPYGLSTNWGNDSPLRYAGTLTELLTVLVSPEIGGFLTDNLALGVGLDLEWARVTFNAIAGSPAGLQHLQSEGVPVTPTFLDSRSENTGNSFGIGFHAGVLALFNDEHTRIGLNFQSAVGHQFEGTSTLSGRLADEALENTAAVYQLDTLSSNDIRLPNITTLSIYQDMTENWVLLGSAVYTGWSVFKTTQLDNVAGFDTDTSLQAPITVLTEQHYRNAWRFALGTLYSFNERWTFRFGGGYDQTPTVNAERDARLPDVDRWAVATGLHYQPRPTIGFDLAYVYLWGAGRAPVHKTQVFNALSNVTVDAWGSNHAQLAGFQAVWRPLD